MLRATEAWHSPVTEAELAATCGTPRSHAFPDAPDHRASGCGDRPAAQLPDHHARSRGLAGSRIAVRHAGPDPGIRTRTVAARFERRAAICRRSKTRLRGVVPQHSGTLTCCSNSIPRGRSSSIKRFPKRGEVGEAGQKVISLRLQ
jgi:hypothetical protein